MTMAAPSTCGWDCMSVGVNLFGEEHGVGWCSDDGHEMQVQEGEQSGHHCHGGKHNVAVT